MISEPLPRDDAGRAGLNDFAQRLIAIRCGTCAHGIQYHGNRATSALAFVPAAWLDFVRSEGANIQTNACAIFAISANFFAGMRITGDAPIASAAHWH